MRKLLTKSAYTILLLTLFIACKKDSSVNQQNNEISQAVLDKIYELGFSRNNVAIHEDGYLVEGDIIITNEALNSVPERQLLRIANEEQYHTFNRVTALPRTIDVSISSQLPASYVTALDESIRRYNAENLQIKMQRVSSGADINIVRGNGSYLASAGFPTSSGDPYGQVKVNSRAIGNGSSTTFINYVATILTHEIGHCIGFRHTDWMDRSYSCGGAPSNEGQSTTGVGAVQIPGTPSNPDSGSFMLACIGSGVNRPFNANDKTALGYLY